MPIYTPEDCKVGEARQTTFGTGVTTGTALNQVTTQAVEIDNDSKVRERGPLEGQRTLTTRSIKTDSIGSMPKINYEEVVRKERLADELYSIFQNVSEDAGSPYKKTFTFHATQPDFTSDAGYFSTVVVADPESNLDRAYIDIITQQTAFTLPVDGELSIAVNKVSRCSGSYYGENYSGSFTNLGETTYHYEQLGRFTINGSNAVPVDSTSVTISQEVQGSGFDSTRKSAETYRLKTKRMTISTTVRDDAAMRDVEAKRDNNQTVAFRMGWGNATAGTDDGDLDFTGTCKVVSFTPVRSGDEKAVQIELEVVDAPQVILADGVDKNW